jgi:hypothetical protein
MLVPVVLLVVTQFHELRDYRLIESLRKSVGLRMICSAYLLLDVQRIAQEIIQLIAKFCSLIITKTLLQR